MNFFKNFNLKTKVRIFLNFTPKFTFFAKFREFLINLRLNSRLFVIASISSYKPTPTHNNGVAKNSQSHAAFKAKNSKPKKSKPRLTA